MLPHLEKTRVFADVIKNLERRCLATRTLTAERWRKVRNTQRSHGEQEEAT